WKYERLRHAGIETPPTLTHVAVDFEQQSLMERLVEAGFRVDQAACFLWLGVTVYLTPEAVMTVLRTIAGVPAAEVIFDYVEPLEKQPPEQRQLLASMSTHAASRGEPWLCPFDSAELHGELRRVGLTDIEDLSPADITSRFLAREKGETTEPFPLHLVRARRAG
ncbi:MAG TPA: class I SAM-dependent methyltransferase, partial [Steroidobacteraceae bacterium]